MGDISSQIRCAWETSDARVRANALEALWNTGGDFAVHRFRCGLSDPHHRVAANALVGLYLLGEADALGGMAAMAPRSEPAFRASAAWAMGRTGDPRFLTLLRGMRRAPDQDPALELLPRREAGIQCLGVQCPAGRKVEALLVVRDGGIGPHFTVKATEWQLRLGGEPVWDYRVSRVDAGSRVALGLVLPYHPFADAARKPQWTAALRLASSWRRQEDRFGVLHYAESLRAHLQSAIPIALPPGDAARSLLTSDPARLLAALSPPAGDLFCEGPVGPLEACTFGLAEMIGDRHLVLVLDSLQEAAWDRQSMLRIAKALVSQRIRLHVITTPGTPSVVAASFRQLAQSTYGFQSHCGDPQGLGDSLMNILAGVFRHYRVEFGVPSSFKDAEVELLTASHHGRANLPLDSCIQTPQAAA